MSDNRARMWFSLFVLAVFCLGGAGGFVLGRQLPRGPFFAGGPPPPGGPDSPAERVGRAPGPPGPGRGGRGWGGPPLFGRGPMPPAPGDIVNRLSSELELDAAQQQRVRKIVEDRRERLEQVHRDARDRFDKEQRDLLAAIRLVLRQDQQARFDKFLERRQ